MFCIVYNGKADAVKIVDTKGEKLQSTDDILQVTEDEAEAITFLLKYKEKCFFEVVRDSNKCITLLGQDFLEAERIGKRFNFDPTIPGSRSKACSAACAYQKFASAQA